ncbi:MAG: hypothetical protein BAJALOKI1v1_1510004 [Promethearchaeota archaeon]|nr:MAG: hypothetical protein BAJALOKI1v1_1510004 [Candidatus Lokiarchaeota archaeon]
MSKNKKELEKLLRRVHKAIFSDKISVEFEDKTYPISKTSKKGLRKLYIDDYFFIEQNPNTKSHWAEKAQKGDEITWAIKDNSYIANIHDDTFHYFENK